MTLSTDIWIVILLIGAGGGWLATTTSWGTGFGLFADVVVGLVGAFVGTWAGPRFGLDASITGAVIGAVIGTGVLLAFAKFAGDTWGPQKAGEEPDERAEPATGRTRSEPVTRNEPATRRRADTETPDVPQPRTGWLFPARPSRSPAAPAGRGAEVLANAVPSRGGNSGSGSGSRDRTAARTETPTERGRPNEIKERAAPARDTPQPRPWFRPS
ncbi:putative membrane protein [Rhodovulum sp. PH10]|uniref:GlsB/YeaQ/YmgE family stress response membrane protein n=1 Tax=Rhodovulum sp. PH10 TaxID=1187851 RepID=UPI00027C1F98|nr:GlsB/YeaQ/YmgE family stress response membrane protein [Rhodovulum sp. PH10]EJW13254.1 putative membrane protein [Rhodovulum sp. PH10]